MRRPITAEQIHELARQLDSSTTLLTATDGDDYKKLIARWADNAIKQAVSVTTYHLWARDPESL